MNKKTAIALAIAAVMLIVGTTLLNIARGRGENFRSFFDGGAEFSVSGGVIRIGDDQKGYTVCKSGEESFSAAEVKGLDIDWISGAVNVEPWDGGAVVIREKASEPLTEGQRMRWKLRNGELSILFCANGESRVPDKTLTVQVPRELTLRSVDADAISAPVSFSGLSVSGGIDADTTSGAVTVRGCACASLDVDTVSGAVTIKETAVSGDMDLDSTGGKLTLSGCACVSLDADTLSGGVEGEALSVGQDADLDSGSGAITLRALRVGGGVDVDTTSGAVELRFADKLASVDVETTSGAVTLAFPKGTVVDLDYDTSSGRLRCAPDNAPRGLPVDVDTVSGNLTVEED